MIEVGRYARTLRHVRAGQVGWRLVHEARLAAYRARPGWFGRLWAPDPAARIEGAPLSPPPRGALDREREVAERWREGRVRYLGEDGPAHDWRAADRPRLWRYERHYHSELVALAALAAAEPGRGWLDEARALCAGWAAACPPPAGDGWEPYPVARRVLSWSLAAALAPGLRDTVAPLLPPHLAFLRCHLERHLLGNHLLCDASALVAGGALLAGRRGEAAARAGEALLARELDRQVLPDGGHAERSAQYHAIVLRDLLVATGLASRAGRATPPGVVRAARAMAQWLVRVRRSRGLPWLNDAAPDATPNVGEVLSLASALGLLAGPDRGWLGSAFGGRTGADAQPAPAGELELPDTGWSVLREGSTELLFEHGPIGPEEQPAHGHSDALSYELVWEGGPVVTDTGVTTYEAGPTRSFERSARAHATVTVGEEGADELWSAFRVGSRGEVEGGPRRAAGPARVLRGRVTSAAGWTHARGLVAWPGRALVVLDAVRGARGAQVVSHVPLDPRIDARAGAIRTPGAPLRFLVLRGTATIPHRAGWVGCGFGAACPRTTLGVRAGAAGRIAYAFLAPGVEVALEPARCVVRAPEGMALVPLDAEGLPR